ncbi:MAG: AIR synthase-related protein [Armatimonadota bacterium]|nr:AIR synthase-related protein [Armatimonadota bacterium]
MVPPERAAAARDHLEAAGERCWVIGHVEAGQGEVRFG